MWPSAIPEIEFIKAPYLNDHPAVIDTFVERVQQILTGDIAMNCQMCKYRSAVLGFEADVGAVQESHHHHVEGINAKGPFEIVNHATITTTNMATTIPMTMATPMRPTPMPNIRLAPSA